MLLEADRLAVQERPDRPSDAIEPDRRRLLDSTSTIAPHSQHASIEYFIVVIVQFSIKTSSAHTYIPCEATKVVEMLLTIVEFRMIVLDAS